MENQEETTNKEELVKQEENEQKEVEKKEEPKNHKFFYRKFRKPVEYIYKYNQIKQYPPTLQEIVAFFNIKSHLIFKLSLKTLEKHGYITRIKMSDEIDDYEKGDYIEVVNENGEVIKKKKRRRKRYTARSTMVTKFGCDAIGVVDYSSLRNRIYVIPCLDNVFQIKNKQAINKKIIIDADLYSKTIDKLIVFNKSSLFGFKIKDDRSKDEFVLNGDILIVHEQKRANENDYVLVKDYDKAIVKRYTDELGNKGVVIGIIIGMIRL